MAKLIKTPNIAWSDDFYADLIGAHEGLSEDDSHAFNARLVLILANHVGDEEVLSEALELASECAPAAKAATASNA